MMLEFIENFRKLNGEHFFLNGWCYIFARILQVKFWGVIYSNKDHCILRKEQDYFDITWMLDTREVYEKWFQIIDECEEARYKVYLNF